MNLHFFKNVTDKIVSYTKCLRQDYYVVNGDANTIIAEFITKLELSSLFETSSEVSGFTLTNYQFERYIDALSGLSKMLKTKNAKLQARFENRKVILSAVPIVNYLKYGFLN